MNGGGLYFVQAGDTLYSIGAELGISPQDIAAINGLSVDAPLTEGETLILPATPSTPSPGVTTIPITQGQTYTLGYASWVLIGLAVVLVLAIVWAES